MRVGWVGDVAEDGAELGEGCGGDLGVGRVGEGFGGVATEEGADDPGCGGGAVRELLIDKGAGEEGGSDGREGIANCRSLRCPFDSLCSLRVRSR